MEEDMIVGKKESVMNVNNPKCITAMERHKGA
jgi:hypothetical protein